MGICSLKKTEQNNNNKRKLGSLNLELQPSFSLTDNNRLDLKSLTGIFNIANVQRTGKSFLKDKATELTYFTISDGQSSTALAAPF